MGSSDSSGLERRKFIELFGLGAAVGVAGCSGNEEGQQTTDEAETTAADTEQQGGNGETSTTESDDGGGGSDRYGGEFVIRDQETVQSLNPYMDIRSSLSRAASMLYSTLVKADQDLQIHGDLASDWESNSANDVWTFTLREDATFNHNGEQVTAEDVKATLDKVYDDDTGSPGQGQLGPFETINVVDDTTVEFELERRSPDFPSFLVQSYASIAPKEIIEDDFESMETTIYGSGPFVLEEFEANSHIRMSAAEEFHLSDPDGNQLPYVDQAELSIVHEDSTAVNQLQNGTVDLIPNLAITQVNRINSMDGAELRETTTGTFGGVVLNCRYEPFDDWRVRKAFKLACNYQPIVDSIMEGYGTVGQDSIIGPMYDQWYVDLERQQDVDRAQELLAEAGYPDGIDLGEEFDITFWSSNEQDYRVPMGLEIQQQLEENLNVTVPFNEITHETYINQYWGDSPMSTVVYEGRVSVDAFLRTLIWSEGGWHSENGWNNDQADQLILDAGAAETDEQRLEYYTELQQLMFDRGPHMVVLYENRLGGVRNHVENYELGPLSRRLWVEDTYLSENGS